MKYRLSSDIPEGFIKAHLKLLEAEEQLNDLILKVDDSEWKGEAKEAFVALVCLCKQYHEKLLKVSDSNNLTLENLYNDAEEFMKNNYSISRWRE